MPTIVRKHLTVAELRPGDTLEETPPAIVESLTRKTTWGAVQIAGEAKPRRLRLDADVMVLREEPTEEEQARQRRTCTVEILKGDLASWLKRDPARMLREIVDNDRGHGEVLTWSNLPDVLKAQAMFRHARTLWHRLGEPADLAAVDGDTLLEAFALWWYTHVHQPSDHGPGTTRSPGRPASSRTSSTTATTGPSSRSAPASAGPEHVTNCSGASHRPWRHVSKHATARPTGRARHRITR